MDSKGQAFSTFQLLIAAIVAVTILVILLHILNMIPPIGPSGNPEEAIANVIKDAVNTPATMKGTGTTVTFKSDAPMVTNEAIAEIADVGLEPEQICISPGEFMEDTEILAPGEKGSDTSKNWEAFEDGSMVRYRGSTKNVSIVVVCHSTATKLLNLIEKYLEPDVKVGWMDGSQGEPASSFRCGCLEDELYKNQKCCLVALRFVK
ncbi:MAG: hypothetical protein J7L44_00910 [Candidatus Diapherotrites archaeon]|nr:hypothetical protein [Candidatus Diapherotrites archaeon]